MTDDYRPQEKPPGKLLMPLHRLIKTYEGKPDGKTVLNLLRAAQSLAEGKAGLVREREQARRHLVISPAQVEEITRLADEAGTESHSERYALMELIQAAAVANCDLASRNRLSIKLAAAAEFADKLERARQAYADALEGVEILRRFFKPYHLVLFDFDENEAENIAESARTGWSKAKSRCPEPLEILDPTTGDPAREWMDLILWNCDSGTGQGLLSQADATLRLVLRLEHWIDKKDEPIAPIMEKMRAQCEIIGQHDSFLAARYLLTLGDALIEVRQWDLAARIHRDVYEKTVAHKDQPLGMRAGIQEAHCYLLSGNPERCRSLLETIDRGHMETLADLIITTAAELARFTALDYSCRRQSGKITLMEAQNRVRDLMTRVRLIVSPRAENRAGYLRNLFFAMLARDVESLFAAAQGTPKTQFQRFWDSVTVQEKRTAIYTEDDWKAEVEIVEDNSDSAWVRFKLKVVRTLQPSKIYSPLKDGATFEVSCRRGCEGEFWTLKR